MSTDTEQVDFLQMIRIRRGGVRTIRILLQFLELQIPMGLGALICYLVVRLISASASFATAYRPGTFRFATGDTLFLTVPVVAWMIFRGHGWRHSLGIAAAMIMPVTLIIVFGRLTTYDYLKWLLTAGYPAMSLGMLVYMLYGSDHFTGQVATISDDRKEQNTMTTDTKQMSSPRRGGIPRVMAGTGYFLLHFLEMCVVMCAVGIGSLSALLRWAGPLMGYPEFKKQFPELSTVLLALWFTVVMIVWMRIRRHEWRPTLEMASTSIAALPLVFGAAWFGVTPNSSLFGLECGLACALMVVAMLLRLDQYTGSHTSHQNQSHASHPAHEHSHHAG